MKQNLEMNDLYKYIGANIRKIREYRKITTSDLASQVHVSDGTIRNIESGKSLSLPLLIQISYALKVQIETLLYDYIYHAPDSKNNNPTVELFIETYSSVSERDKMIIEQILLSFNKTL